MDQPVLEARLFGFREFLQRLYDGRRNDFARLYIQAIGSFGDGLWIILYLAQS